MKNLHAMLLVVFVASSVDQPATAQPPAPLIALPLPAQPRSAELWGERIAYVRNPDGGTREPVLCMEQPESDQRVPPTPLPKKDCEASIARAGARLLAGLIDGGALER